ncbi:MAG: hypothetical protein NTZ67_05605 [Gammaproteobacteria bacterium]|nr:hypothetical protein [Gammaproteobacteria bacterium]
MSKKYIEIDNSPGGSDGLSAASPLSFSSSIPDNIEESTAPEKLLFLKKSYFSLLSSSTKTQIESISINQITAEKFNEKISEISKSLKESIRQFYNDNNTPLGESELDKTASDMIDPVKIDIVNLEIRERITAELNKTNFNENALRDQIKKNAERTARIYEIPFDADKNEKSIDDLWEAKFLLHKKESKAENKPVKNTTQKMDAHILISLPIYIKNEIKKIPTGEYCEKIKVISENVNKKLTDFFNAENLLEGEARTNRVTQLTETLISDATGEYIKEKISEAKNLAKDKIKTFSETEIEPILILSLAKFFDDKWPLSAGTETNKVAELSQKIISEVREECLAEKAKTAADAKLAEEAKTAADAKLAAEAKNSAVAKLAEEKKLAAAKIINPVKVDIHYRIAEYIRSRRNETKKDSVQLKFLQNRLWHKTDLTVAKITDAENLQKSILNATSNIGIVKAICGSIQANHQLQEEHRKQSAWKVSRSDGEYGKHLTECLSQFSHEDLFKGVKEFVISEFEEKKPEEGLCLVLLATSENINDLKLALLAKESLQLKKTVQSFYKSLLNSVEHLETSIKNVAAKIPEITPKI